MSALRVAVAVVWLLFWAYWLASARGVKSGSRGYAGLQIRVILLVVVIVLVRVIHVRSVEIHSVPVEVVGAVIFLSGLALAVWARRHLGRNWGMPMTLKDEPELVSTGPYRLVRHPIYTGLLLGLLGTALMTSLLGLVVVVIAGVYFYYAATVEERNLAASMPQSYPAYRARTKMLIPLIL
ncbi:MAG: isoprenylcysteine carboxylmethyltransferase family protein [Actinobacteria bacterium]|nr:isoprenylcysteine carboxylmethyltransferase family protein [Actinomycetota bacterium]